MSIYFDNNSTTLPSAEAVDTMVHYLKDYGVNPSSIHTPGKAAGAELNRLRREIAESIGAKENEILFVGSGSEANNFCIKGYCRHARCEGKKHIITTAIEHPSVLRTFDQLEREGFDITILPVDSQGFVSPEMLLDAVRPDTMLVSIAHSNNEIGTVQNIKQLRALVPDVVFHTDAVQSFCKLPFDVRDNGVDLASFSGHKIHAPKGVGFIYKREGIELDPIINGGSQEFGLRAGTENLASIAAMATAIKNMSGQDVDKIRSLQKKLIEGLLGFEGTVINGPEDLSRRNPTNVSVAFSGHEAEAIVNYLNEHEIYVSTRSACSSNSKQVSHVLAAVKTKHQYIHATIRIGLSKYNTEAEVDKFLECLAEYLAKNKPYLDSAC